MARLFDFQPGATIISADLDSEFNQLVNFLNGTLTTKNGLFKFNGGDPVLALDALGAGAIEEWRLSGSAKARIKNNGQFESLLATGTSPFVVASTTRVDNLNADLLDGLSSAAFALIGYRTVGSVTWFYDIAPAGVETTESQGRWIVPGVNTGAAFTAYQLDIVFGSGSHTGGGSITFTIKRRNAAGTLQADMGTVTLDGTNNTIQLLYPNDISDVPITARDQIYPLCTARSGTITEANISVSLTFFQTLTP